MSNYPTRQTGGCVVLAGRFCQLCRLEVVSRPRPCHAWPRQPGKHPQPLPQEPSGGLLGPALAAWAAGTLSSFCSFELPHASHWGDSSPRMSSSCSWRQAWQTNSYSGIRISRNGSKLLGSPIRSSKNLIGDDQLTHSLRIPQHGCYFRCYIDRLLILCTCCIAVLKTAYGMIELLMQGSSCVDRCPRCSDVGRHVQPRPRHVGCVVVRGRWVVCVPAGGWAGAVAAERALGDSPRRWCHKAAQRRSRHRRHGDGLHK